jgi:hypothetical protein
MDLVFIGVFVGLVLLLVGMVEGCDRLMARGYAGRKPHGTTQSNGGEG